MAPFKTVKVKGQLYAEMVKALGQKRLRYEFPSIASFVNAAIYEKLEQVKERKFKFPKLKI